MRKNALEEILNKELFIEYFQQDNINEENLKKTFSLINKISKQFENEKGAEEEIFDIFIQEFYELLDIEIKNRNE